MARERQLAHDGDALDQLLEFLKQAVDAAVEIVAPLWSPASLRPSVR